MSVHEQFAEDLALYALGGLEGDERAQLEKHLEGCAGCRRELEQLRGDMALMALSAAGPAPPRRARQRLLEAVGRERRSPAAPARRSWWTLVPWVAAATLAVGLVSVWRQKSDLQRQIADLQNESARQFEELRQAREVVSTLTATDALRVTVVAAKTPPQKAYELWLVPTSGAPIAAGVFKPDTHGSAIVINPPLPAGVEAKAFAITVEPESGSPAATSPIIMFGAGE